jgi:hypothetical protein
VNLEPEEAMTALSIKIEGEDAIIRRHTLLDTGKVHSELCGRRRDMRLIEVTEFARQGEQVFLEGDIDLGAPVRLGVTRPL